MSVSSAFSSPTAPLLPRALGLLRRAGTPRLRLGTYAFAIVLGLGAIMYRSWPPLWLPVLFLWLFWMPRIAMLQREARLERIPGLGAPIALLLAAGVALFFLATFDLDFARPWLILIVGATLTVMFTSWRVLSMLSVAALLLAFATALLQVALGIEFNRTLWVFDNLAFVKDMLAILSTITALVAAHQWGRFVRRSLPTEAPMDAFPLLLLSQARLQRTEARIRRKSYVRLGLTGWLALDRRASAPSQPLRAMRIWLGFPFTPMGWRRIVLRITIISLVATRFLDSAVPRDSEGNVTSTFVLPILFIMMFVPYLRPLRRLAATRGGDLDELALIPGWGGGARTHRLFARAVLATPLQDLVWFAVLVGMLVVPTDSTLTQLSALSALVVLPIASIAIGLSLLALGLFTQRLGIAMRVLAWGLIWTVALSWFLFPLPSELDRWELDRIVILAWTTLLALGTLALWRCLHTFRARPHPFVSH
jgi:hypothetical protein